jgi:hypothetical protein
MKLSNKALSLFPAWANFDNVPDALKMLASYAAKSPGLEFGDYCRGWQDKEGRAAYFRESRQITKELHRVRDAIRQAYALDVSDDLLIECSKGERLTLERDGDNLKIDYCVGQYWPTEYRSAVARLLERAIKSSELKKLAA